MWTTVGVEGGTSFTVCRTNKWCRATGSFDIQRCLCLVSKSFRNLWDTHFHPKPLNLSCSWGWGSGCRHSTPRSQLCSMFWWPHCSAACLPHATNSPIVELPCAAHCSVHVLRCLLIAGTSIYSLLVPKQTSREMAKHIPPLIQQALLQSQLWPPLLSFKGLLTLCLRLW